MQLTEVFSILLKKNLGISNQGLLSLPIKGTMTASLTSCKCVQRNLILL